MTDIQTATASGNKPPWHQTLAMYQHADRKKALWQTVNTFTLYILAWGLMILNLRHYHSAWIHLALLLIASGLFLRIFIFFHDCSHQSFFASRRANTFLGHICGILTFTPFESWRRSHSIHHNTVSNLDRRGHGDIWTMTVEEYRVSTKFKRLQYRMFRNPLVLFLLGPAYVLLIEYRFAGKGDGRRQTVSRYITNIGIASLLLVALWLIGWRTYLAIQLPILVIAGACGFWLFYIQHQFEGVYWARHNSWDSIKASLEGSSFYELPAVLQWFSGNIGFHHIHHMRPRIPNYHLQQCQKAVAPWLIISPLRLRESLRSLRLKLWDEKRNQLVGFKSAKTTG